MSVTSARHESFVHCKATQAGSRLHGESVPECSHFDPSTGTASLQCDLFIQPSFYASSHTPDQIVFSGTLETSQCKAIIGFIFLFKNLTDFQYMHFTLRAYLVYLENLYVLYSVQQCDWLTDQMSTLRYYEGREINIEDVLIAGLTPVPEWHVPSPGLWLAR